MYITIENKEGIKKKNYYINYTNSCCFGLLIGFFIGSFIYLNNHPTNSSGSLLN